MDRTGSTQKGGAGFTFCFAWQRRWKSHWFPTTQARSDPRREKQVQGFIQPTLYGGASSGTGLMGSQCGVYPLVSEHTYSLTVQPVNIHEPTMPGSNRKLVHISKGLVSDTPSPQ